MQAGTEAYFPQFFTGTHVKSFEITIEIADKAGKLYDKFVGFYTDLMAVEKNLDRTSSSLVDAMKKLKVGTGDLIGKVQELKTLGAKAKKSLPESLLGEDDN